MSTIPLSKLDRRFSDPGATAVSWDETLDVIQKAELFWITTVRSDGRPHVTPLPAIWLDGSLHFCTGADEQKAVNLRRNGRVVLTTGCNTWDKGVDVVVEGDATIVTDDALLDRLAAAWRGKWDGQWRYDVRDGRFVHEAGEAIVFAVRPTKVLAFGKGRFSHTSHRF